MLVKLPNGVWVNPNAVQSLKAEIPERRVKLSMQDGVQFLFHANVDTPQAVAELEASLLDMLDPMRRMELFSPGQILNASYGMEFHKVTPDNAEERQLRGSGRTTASMLRAIAHAIENPQQWVPWRDHAGTLTAHREMRGGQMKAIIKRLGLNMEVSPKPNGELQVRSNWGSEIEHAV